MKRKKKLEKQRIFKNFQFYIFSTKLVETFRNL